MKETLNNTVIICPIELSLPFILCAGIGCTCASTYVVFDEHITIFLCPHHMQEVADFVITRQRHVVMGKPQIVTIFEAETEPVSSNAANQSQV